MTEPTRGDNETTAIDLPADAMPADTPPPGPLRRLALTTGSAALLLAMATDALAVAGRHLGFTVLGTIEIFEMCIVVAATSAIIIATLDRSHARVRILLERLSGRAARRFERGADAVAALIFLVLAAGSSWLTSDLWGGHELTEVLGLPLRWFRVFWIAGCLVTAALFAIRAARRPR